VTADFYKK
jgi:hypothetical protein